MTQRRTTNTGRLIAAAALAMVLVAGRGPAARADDPDNCLFCHRYRGLSRYDPVGDRIHLYFVQPEYALGRIGPHGRLTCTDCHARREVGVVPHRSPTPVDCLKTCHLSDPTRPARRFSHGNIAGMLAGSVHRPDALARLEFAGGPLLEPGQSVCLYCHDEPLFRDPRGAIPALTALDGRVFDRCDPCHREQVRADIAYYLRHVASRLQPARPTLETAQICAVCHSDPRVRRDFGMRDAVASYMRSYHGKAALLGDTRTANCLSCHVARGANVHQMLPPDDPRSSVNPQRLADACRTPACHPGADPALASAGVHLDLPTLRGSLEYIVAAFFIVLTVLAFGPPLVIVLLELLSIVVGRTAQTDVRLHRLAEALLADPRARRALVRFTLDQRVQHWVLVLLFVLLALTGFPLKFASQTWARTVIDALGGLGVARRVHHSAGLALVAGMVLHLLHVLWLAGRRARRERGRGRPAGLLRSLTGLPMWLGWRDLRKAMQLLGYLLFVRRQRPTFGRFSVQEKFEYFGVFWGTTLLGLTGLMLWGEQTASRLLGGRVLNIALIAHTYEAFLAVIHVGILHIVHVVLAPEVFPLSRATITGQTPPAKLAATHGELLESVAQRLGHAVPGDAT